MKSYIDFFETLKGEFVGSLKFKNKFIRLWGTTSIDGVQVLNPKFEIYPNTESMHIQKFLKHIGAQSQINGADFENVQSYYFWLNSSKADTLNQEDLNDIIASKINSYCTVGEKLIINLNFSNAGDYNYFKNFTKQQIFDYITNDYDAMYNMLDNYSVGETLLTTTIGSYILFDNGQHFDISILKATVSSVATKVRLHPWDDDYTTVYKAGISLEIQAIRKSNITGSANIVTHIVDEANEYTTAKATAIQQLLESSNNESTTSGFTWIKNRTGKTDDIWYKGQMRVSFIEDSAIKTKEKINILISALDTGYTVPKTKWWKKALGPVLIVIAIVMAIPTGGLSLEALPAFLAALAINVGIATLVITGLSAYWAKHGDPGATQYMGRWIKVGSIISAVAGISGLIANIARQAAMQAATTAATETAVATGETSTVTATTMGQTATVTATPTVTAYGTTTTIVEGGTGALVSETATVGFSDFVSAGWDSMYNGMTSSWQSIASTGLKMVRFFTNMRFQSQAKSLQSEINAKTEQNDKANKELEEMNDKEVNIALDDIKWYTSPLKIESQRYEIDYLYGGTKMNIGRPSFVTGRGLNIISNDVYDVNKI
jgi:hypothetical protein